MADIDTLATLRRWAEALCTLERADVATVARTLGLGAFDEGPTWVVVAEPPTGVKGVKLAKREGQIDYVAIDLDGPTRAEHDAAFGAGLDLPVMPPAMLRQTLYRVTVAGAPVTCAVIPRWASSIAASTGGPPGPPAPPALPTPPSAVPRDVRCTEVTLRRDRAVTR